MSLKHVVLGLLDREDLSGYDIKRHLRTTVPNLWDVSDGQLYPLLKRLRRDGLIDEVPDPAENGRQYYRICDSGRQELLAWLREPETRTPDLKDGFLSRLLYFDRLDKREVQQQIDRQRRAGHDQCDNLRRARRSYTPGATSFQRTLLDYSLLFFETRDLFLELLDQRSQRGDLSRTEPMITDEQVEQWKKLAAALREQLQSALQSAA